MRAGATLILDKFIPERGRCKVTQQPDEVAYIPKTPYGGRVLLRQEEAPPRERAQGETRNRTGLRHMAVLCSEEVPYAPSILCRAGAMSPRMAAPQTPWYTR